MMMDVAPQLTPREREVLQLLCHGLIHDQALAERLSVTQTTISYHVQNLMAKCEVNSRGALIGYAYRHGLVEAW